MKKLFAIVLSGVFLFSSCGNPRKSGYVSDGTDPEICFVGPERSTRTDGIYFNQRIGPGINRLYYVDYSNCLQTPVCPKPNCPHTDPDTCYAIGYGNGATAILPHDDKIYWLYYLGYDEGYGSVIYRANRDGTGRETVCKIEGLACLGGTLLTVGDTMYFTAESMTFDEHGLTVDEPLGAYLYSYNFESGDLRQEYDFSEQLSSYDKVDATIKGAWNGGIYLYVTAGNKVIDKITENGSNYHYTHSACYFRYDISEGTLEKCDISPWNISGGYMIYLEGSTVRLIHESGNEYEFKNAGASLLLGAFVVNNKLFISNKVIDIETGKKYERLTDSLLTPIAYRDGQYILADDKDFKKLPENKVIGDEIT